MKKRLSRAERRERNREELVAAAERLFTERGFHATSVDEIALEAGYTKGAVYSNFTSKEDLFLTVYEQQAERTVAEMELAVDEAGPAAGLERIASEVARRRGRDDGWLAVFFEFWAHVVRNPESRDRFAEIHARALEPLVAATRRLAEERGVELPVDATAFTVAMNAMQLALSLERLTQPEVVDVELGARMVRFVSNELERGAAAREREEEG